MVQLHELMVHTPPAHTKVSAALQHEPSPHGHSARSALRSSDALFPAPGQLTQESAVATLLRAEQLVEDGHAEQQQRQLHLLGQHRSLAGCSNIYADHGPDWVVQQAARCGRNFVGCALIGI